MRSPKLEILISTMHRTDLSFLFAMCKEIQPEACTFLIVNQTMEDRLLTSPYNNIRVINSFEKGLSKSRNLALQHAIGNICLIADDDTLFIPGFDRTIKQAFKNYNAALITFQVATFEGTPYRKYRNNPGIVTRHRDIEDLSSVEMAFRRKPITDHALMFNERFGLNSDFEMGEEYLFARDVLRSGLGVAYLPEKIVKHSRLTSTSDYGHDKVLYAKGALSSIKHPYTTVLWLIKFVFFLARKGYIRWTEAAAKLRIALQGIRDHKKLSKFTQ